MLVVRGRHLEEYDAPRLAADLAPYERLAIDVGTGDGRFAYALAKRHPGRFAIGIDPVKEQLREVSARALRKPSRGGLPNLLLVWATVEAPPAELAGRAQEVHVVLPWGKLLAGIVRGEADVLGGLRHLAAPGATLELTVGTDIWQDPVPLDLRDLPPLDLPYVDQVMAPALARHRLRVTAARRLTPGEVAAIPSTWARRLAHGRGDPHFVRVHATAEP